MNIHVISTGFAPPTADLYRYTVEKQVLRSRDDGQFIRVAHHVIDAAKQATPKSCLQNLSEAIAPLPPGDIVVHLDLDDWLEDERVLQRIYDAHAAGAWLTYGSYTVASTGEFVRCRPYATGTWRSEPGYQASHLKTFRAGLFQSIPLEYLKIAGKWVPLACDLAAMFPMLDMATMSRAHVFEAPMVRYYDENSFARRATPEERDRARYFDREIRAMKPLAAWSSWPMRAS